MDVGPSRSISTLDPTYQDSVQTHRSKTEVNTQNNKLDYKTSPQPHNNKTLLCTFSFSIYLTFSFWSNDRGDVMGCFNLTSGAAVPC